MRLYHSGTEHIELKLKALNNTNIVEPASNTRTRDCVLIMRVRSSDISQFEVQTLRNK